MRRFLTIAGALVLCLALAAGTVGADTLGEREGTEGDGYTAIDGSPGAPEDVSCTNWKHQYGESLWSGIYSMDEGWTCEEGDEEKLDVECDIEMYCQTSMEDYLIYFHLANVTTATGSDKEAEIPGNVTGNHDYYIGLSFDGTGKVAEDFDTSTGVITDAMQATEDAYGNPITETFNIKLLCKELGDASWSTPSDFNSAGSDGTQPHVLWWDFLKGRGPGSHDIKWQLTLLPDAYQADGEYSLEPAVVVAPGI
jgi:hypothetical protein